MKHCTFKLKNSIHSYIYLIVCLLGTAFPAKAYTPDYLDWVSHGIRYWYFNDYETVHDFDNLLSVPEMRFSGFRSIQSPGSGLSRVYVAPDGKLVKRFTGAYVIYPWRENENPPYYDKNMSQFYKGDMVIPDRVDNYPSMSKADCYVLGMDKDGFRDELTSIRTPRYALIFMNNFVNAVNLNKVQIGACYEVYPYGFKNCKKLETVIFEHSPYVYDLAFRDCAAIKTIILTDELPTLQSDKVFEKAVYSGATLYVLDELMDKCKQDPVWSKFTNLKPYSELPSTDILMPRPVSYDD